MNRIARLAFLAALPAILIAGCGPGESSGPPPPQVSTINAAGIEKLVKDAHGKVLVMNFWATWCPPCVKEMPELARFNNEYKDKGVVFVSISADHPTTIEDRIKPFMQVEEIPFPVHVMDAVETGAMDALLTVEWGGGLPATFIYGKDGKLAHWQVEEIDFEGLEKIVKPLLGK